MKTAVSKRFFIMFLALAMVMGMGLLAAPLVSAESEAVTIYASNLYDDSQLDLSDDTVLVMDVDRRLSAIIGEDYDLTIEGSGKLTVNGGDNGIDVKSLHCTSDLFVQPGWHAIEVSETVYIHNTESFIVGGIYAGGHIDIQSNNATIGGNGNAIFSSLGNITLSGDTFDIGANGIAVEAETGGIYMTGNFTVNSNNDRTIHTARGEVVIEGSLKSTSGAKFDPDVSFVGRDNISICAREGFFFYGTTLEVEGLGGIGAGNYNGDADISITADSVSIITERYYALNGGNIYVDSDNLWIENEGSEENENVPYTFHTIFADGDATLSSENGGIVGENCFLVDGNLTLNGNFVVGADHDSGYAMRSIGRTEVNGNLRVIAEDITCVYAEKGFSFNGSTLKLEGHQGIAVQNGDVNIVADSTEIVASDYCAIRDETGNDSVCNVYIDSDYLWLQGGKDEVRNSGCVDVRGNVTIYSDEAIVMGNYGIDAVGDIVLDGNFVVLGYLQEAIHSESRVEARGKLSLATEGVYSCLTAQEFIFDGTTLTADGYSGIWGKFTDIHADSVVITTSVGDALDGDEVYVTANYLWAENKATKVDSDWQKRGGTQFGIAANSKLALTVKGGTVIGYDHALAVYDEYDKFEFHYIYVNGHLTAVSQTGVGMYAPQGTVELYGGPIVSVGESHGIDAKDVVFEGGSLRVEGDTGIHAISSVELNGEDVRITAFNERRSGIWCEGDTTLAGAVFIRTNGWYGVNGEGNVNLYEGCFDIAGPKGDAQVIKVGGELYMDESLSFIAPSGAHLRGTDICDAAGFPAKEVLIGKLISEISVNVNTPVAGNQPIRYSEQVYNMPLGSSVRWLRWYKNGEPWDVSSGNECFEAGNSYRLEINLVTCNGYYFADPLTSAAINYQTAEVSTPSGLPAYEIVLSLDFGKCPAVVYNVELTIDTPREQNFPDQSVTCGSSIYEQALVGDNMFDTPLQWQKSEDGTTWSTMDLNETFAVGYYYRVFIDIMPANGYRFAIDPQIEPDVSAKVNGFRAEVTRYPEEDPEELISVCYNFGLLNHSIIQQIDIDGVTEPVVGEHPDYGCAISGTGYSINTAYSNGTYVINGLCWRDITDDKWMYPGDTFEIGHEYRVFIDVKTDDGYEFDTEQVGSSYVPTGWGYINDNYATLGIQSDGRFEQSLSWTFTCERKTVKSVAVGGLDVPVQGAMPDYDAVADLAYYTVDSVTWFDYTTGLDMTDSDTFVDGHEYWVLVTVVPNEIEGSKLCRFVPDKTVAMLNGIEVRKDSNKHWQEVESAVNFVRIYYTYICGEEEPIVIRVQPASRMVTGGQTAKFSVTAIGDGLTYQWEYRPDANTDWSDSGASGNKTATLSISGAKHRNGFEYRCKITDAHGNVRYTEAAKLTVTTSIVVTQQPVSVTVAAGEKATVTVDASGDNLSYAWYYRDGSSGAFKLTTSFTGNSYSVTMNATRNGRQVYCVITDANGFSAQTATVTLGMKATIITQPKSASVKSKETITVSLEAAGDGLTYTWYYSDDGGLNFKKTTSFTGNSYSITMTGDRAGRKVYCVVTDKFGNSVTSKTVTLGMRGSAAIRTQPVSVTVANGETAKVAVRASGTGLTYEWYFSDNGGLSFSKTTAFTGNSYSIKMTSARAGRQVYCVVTDKNGNSVQTDTVTLGMTGKAAIRTQPVSVTVANGETAMVAVRASGTGLTYEWYYSDNGGLSFYKTTAFTGSSYYVPMTTARAGRQVYCVVTDKNGNSVQTDTVTLGMTGKAAIHTQPVSVTVANGETAMIAVRASGTGLTYEWYYSDNGGKKYYKTTAFTGSSYYVPMNASRAGRMVYCVITDANGNKVTTDVVTLNMG